jgi:hypothetical protein
MALHNGGLGELARAAALFFPAITEQFAGRGERI